MGTVRLPGKTGIEVILRRSARARRISLRVSGLDGRVTLTLPPDASEREGLRFARAREDWIAEALADRPAAQLARVGVTLPVEGRPRPVVEGPARGVRIDSDRIRIPPGPGGPARLGAALRTLARDRLATAVDRHAAALGRVPGRLTLRDTRSRWGSCSSRGDLMFSWRLILAPPQVLDYVAAHEVAHLDRMDHSPAFWAVVERLLPDHGAQRAWLRRNGAALHGWRFKD